MKKLLLFAVIAATVLCSNAQFSVNKNGRIAIGDGLIREFEKLEADSIIVNPGIGGGGIGILKPTGIRGDGSIGYEAGFNYITDSFTRLYVFGDSLDRGARISFGDYSNYSYPKVMVGELEGENTDRLQLHGDSGMYFSRKFCQNLWNSLK